MTMSNKEHLHNRRKRKQDAVEYLYYRLLEANGDAHNKWINDNLVSSYNRAVKLARAAERVVANNRQWL